MCPQVFKDRSHTGSLAHATIMLTAPPTHLLMWAASAGNQPGTSRLGLTEDTAKAHFHGWGPAEEALADGTDRLGEEGSETCSTLALPRESLTLTTWMKKLSRMAPGIDLIFDCSERGEFRSQ